MRLDKNPFITRASEYIDMEEHFIQLFSAEVLQLFSKENKLWSRINVFRSAPGGGKTTLLKLFTPAVLHAINANKNHNEHTKSVFEQLKEHGVFSKSDKIDVIGCYIGFNSEYKTLEYLPFAKGQQLRVFFALVNIRTILSFFKALCQVRNLKYPVDLCRVKFQDLTAVTVPAAFHGIKNGFELYEWAIVQEEKIFDEIDNINHSDVQKLQGADDLYALSILASKNVLIDGSVLKEKCLIMFDDGQNLDPGQREHLIKTITDKRPQVYTWFAERLKALTMEELLSEGQLKDREATVFELEKLWTKKYQQFEKFAKSVANRRLHSAFSEHSYDFSSFLQTSMQLLEVKVYNCMDIVKKRVYLEFGSKEKFSVWIAKLEAQEGDPYQQLIEWRVLEILMFREANQSNLFENEILDEEDLEESQDNALRTAAKLFLHFEFDLPFYYGIDVVCRLASSNIEQFLTICSELFEQIRSNSIKKILRGDEHLHLTPQKQQQIILKIANDRWNHLNTSVSHFTDIKRLLDSIGEFCKQETFVPNAWNAPGINGVAITMAERNLLKDVAFKDSAHQYHHLARCLALCISYNLVDVKLNYRCKGKDMMLIYLNRLYCARYDLPLNNGKFREKNLKTLLGWLNNGLSSQTKMKM